MNPPCRHQISRPSDGAFLTGHCPLCLMVLALQPPSAKREKRQASGEPEEPGDSPRLSFTPGKILGGRYQLISLIGRGGMGDVYRAEDLRLTREVALKFLAPSRAVKEFAAISSEVRHGIQVAHPNVCRLYDLAKAEGHYFIVMEMIEGDDLASLLARFGPLPRAKAMDLAGDLCAALAACHEREVIHGDLKPGNVMIDRNGRARIMDFGLATLVGTGPEARSVAGTLAYIAPEQLLGSGASVEADLYALGLVLYEMFTGRRVRDVRTLEELSDRIDTPPPAPSTIAPVPPAVEGMIMKCLERRPLRRPRSVAEVAMVFPRRDPIDAALAAGEIPSPSSIAASRSKELSPLARWSFLGGSILGLLLTVAGAERFTAVGRANLRQNPEVLAQKAREIITNQSVPYRNSFEAYGFTTRGKLRSRSEPPSSSLAFFYRQSAARLMPVVSLRRVSPTDPPADIPGITIVGLDPDGHLRFLHALPPESEAGIPGESVSWNELFASAALDPAEFTIVRGGWIPPVAHQQKREWISKSADGRPSVRAALHRGRAVYFDVRDDSSGRVAGTAPEHDWWSRYTQITYVTLLILSFLAGGILAARKVRSGRTDFRGAGRVAGLVIACRLLFWIFSMDFNAMHLTAQVIVRGVGQALFEAAQVWLAYVALEPFVRRYLPRLIIGWNRVMEGRFSDPVVGGDLLAGGMFGILLVLVGHLRGWAAVRLGEPQSHPLPMTLELLSGRGELIATVFYGVARAVAFALLGLFLFLLARETVKKPAIAGTLWILFAALTWARGEQLGPVLPVAVTVALVQAVLSLWLLFRFGLLAAVTMFFVYLMLSVVPLSVDLTRWYARFDSVGTLILIAGLLSYGFYTSLGQKPLFGRRIMDV